MTSHSEPTQSHEASLSGATWDEAYASDEIIERAADLPQGRALFAPDEESDDLLEVAGSPKQRPLKLKKRSHIHVPHHLLYPPLEIEQILAWADAHYERTGKWPRTNGGPILEAAGETWSNVSSALSQGTRGLPGNSSLAQLLSEHRGYRNPRALPPLSESQILIWADAHHERTGRWPTSESGAIAEAPGENWKAIDGSLLYGRRDLPGGSTLARLLAAERGSAVPRLTEAQILTWADAHHAATGNWPMVTSGAIVNTSGETWGAINIALVTGGRGLPGGSTLARLLAAQRGVPNPKQLPLLTEDQILAWADAHYERTGHWPKRNSGYVVDAPSEKWAAINSALHQGCRGFPGGSSLAKLLLERRGVAHNLSVPQLSVSQILVWVDAYRREYRRWPSPSSGAIEAAPGETWCKIDTALKQGLRGLPGGSSLMLLQSEGRDPSEGIQKCALADNDEGPAAEASSSLTLHEMPRIRPRSMRSAPLSPEQILSWADAYYQHNGRWPNTSSGPIADSSGETWYRVSQALYEGSRGLPGGSSLARLLAEHRGQRDRNALPRFTEEQILAWADAHHDRTGKWPTAESGPIAEVPGETWKAVAMALAHGRRGLPGGSTLAHLLAEQRNLRHPDEIPRLTEEQILVWADAYHATTGKWPISKSGVIAGTTGETWSAVHAALKVGVRGLPGGSTLAQLLLERRGVVHHRASPRLSESQILAWAIAYRQQHGRWPYVKSGPVDGMPGQTWVAINTALIKGLRGLPGGSSLKQLLEKHKAA